MMKNLISIILIWLSLGNLTAQEISSDLISNGGKSDKTTKHQHSYSLGEIVIGSGQSQQYAIHHGYGSGEFDPTEEVITTKPIYAIGEIPPLSVWHGQVLELYVRPDTNLAYPELTATWNEPQPTGYTFFRPQNGYFSFQPKEADKDFYYLTFQAIVGSDTLSQEVEVNVIAKLPSEHTIISTTQERPKLDDKSFMLISEIDTLYEEPKFFNGVFRDTNRVVSISGLEVVFAEGNQNNLWESYNGALNIEQLHIYARKLTLESPLHLPQTDIFIYAEEIIFTNPSASFNTQPIDIKIANNQNGRDGDKGGDIHLNIRQFRSNGGFHFFLNGGNGQQASEADGFQSGKGGAGGDLYATAEISRFSDLSGGQGLDTAYTDGPQGKFEFIDKQMSWLHPNMLTMAFKYARDLYLTGFSKETASFLKPYEQSISEYELLAEWEDLDPEIAKELSQQGQEIEKIIHQISFKLDYYGNPEGWVPLLSFEITYSAFLSEIERSIKLMYLNYWIQKRADSIEDRVLALTNAKDQQNEEIEGTYDFIKRIDIDNTLPFLEEEADQNHQRLERLRDELINLEKEVEERAERSLNKKKKKSIFESVLSFGAKLAKLIPVPGLSKGVEGVLNLTSNFCNRE